MIFYDFKPSFYKKSLKNQLTKQNLASKTQISLHFIYFFEKKYKNLNFIPYF